MKIIGLTGNSGSGKSAVADILRESGGYIIDCDMIAHSNMLRNGIAYNDIISEFGNGITDEGGEINRKRLGGIVFNDKNKLELLNRITHKYITDEVNRQIEEIKNKPREYKCIVIDAPLLIEAGLEALVNEIWVVSAGINKKIERIMVRDDITKDMAIARLKNQRSDEELIKRADVVIYNNGDDICELREMVNNKFKE